MKRIIALLAGMLIAALLVPALATHVASASPSYKRSPSINTNVVMTYTFPITETGVDSLAFEVNGLCSVVYESAGSDDASLYAVPTGGTATGSGTLIVAYTDSSTVPTVFQPGTRWVRAVAVSAVTGGSIMRITCSNTQMASTGEACGTSGLVPYVGTGGRYKCEADLSYDETANQLSVGSVANKNEIRMEGNATFEGDAPTGAEVVLHSLTTGEVHIINAASPTTDGARAVVAKPDYFDHIISRGVRYIDLTNEYGGTPSGGFVEERTCLRIHQYAAVTMVDDNAVSGGDTSVLPVQDGCSSTATLPRGQNVTTIPGDPFIKFAWCTSNTNVLNDWGTSTIDLTDSVPNYEWVASSAGTDEWYVQLNGGGDPTLTRPTEVIEDPAGVDNTMTFGTLGALAVGEWGYGDNDAAIAFDTVYVRLTATGDPDLQVDGWVNAEYTDGVDVVFEVSNAPTSVEFAQEVVTLRYNAVTLAAEYGSALRNAPLRIDVNAYASSFFSGGLSPGDIDWTQISYGIHRIWREDVWNALDMECGMGMEFRR